jgi:hypothetical protein
MHKRISRGIVASKQRWYSSAAWRSAAPGKRISFSSVETDIPNLIAYMYCFIIRTTASGTILLARVECAASLSPAKYHGPFATHSQQNGYRVR